MTTYDDYGMPVGVYSEPESLTHQALRLARAFAVYRVKPAVERQAHRLRHGNWTFRGLFSVVRVLLVLWVVTLYWGERSLFDGAVESCRWENWEDWGSEANPHRLVFVADPQLVDPHTYPGRPWPLNPLTVQHTDLYLRRAYSRIQTVLYPDSVVFLGDLFDGGREWSTRFTKSPEEQYRKYGNDFWLREYNRFGNIFFAHWADGGLEPRPGQPGRKIISSLPGNHDLGFGKGIQASVRKRFNAYFGDGNRIDILGNHTFVQIDSVSLSALGQESPNTVQELWKPTMEFLEHAKEQKYKLVQRELRVQQGLKPYPGFSHEIIEEDRLPTAELPHSNDTVTEFPTILLTHVPLYRNPGTPCGPLREHWPPTPVAKGEPPLESDDRNAIAVRGGYQYQNVLNKEITSDIAEKVGGIGYAFSGDDHDYCDVVHRGYASSGGGIREITVKSISWAMGVRHPGFQMVSMWNPVNELGSPLKGDASKTLQTHLCLLPDQLAIFIRYATLFGFTLVALALRALAVMTGMAKSTYQPSADSPLLPTVNANASSAENEKAEQKAREERRTEDEYTHSSNSSSASERGRVQVRPARAGTRGGGLEGEALGGYGGPMQQQQQGKYTFPLIQHAGYYGGAEEEKRVTRAWGEEKKEKKRVRKKGLALFWEEFWGGLVKVGIGGFAWFFWLVWRG